MDGTGSAGPAQPALACAAATVLLGIRGLLVTAVTETPDGQTLVEVITDPAFEAAYHLLGLVYLDRHWNRKALDAFRQAQRGADRIEHAARPIWPARAPGGATPSPASTTAARPLRRCPRDRPGGPRPQRSRCRAGSSCPP